MINTNPNFKNDFNSVKYRLFTIIGWDRVRIHFKGLHGQKVSGSASVLWNEYLVCE